MENDSGQERALKRESALYGNVFHKNICWQRSYQKPAEKEMIMSLYGSLREGL